jgi:hypothetical protein
MNIKEIRIGNKLLRKMKTHSTIIEVLIISESGHINYSNADQFHGIELTPEILEKAGFVKFVDEDLCEFYSIDDFSLEYMEFAIEEGNGFYFDRHFSDELKVNHLHQLQNLYYVLIGEELEIEL